MLAHQATERSFPFPDRKNFRNWSFPLEKKIVINE